MILFHFNCKQEDLFCLFDAFLEQSLVSGILTLAKFLHNLVGNLIGRQFDIVKECTLVFMATDDIIRTMSNNLDYFTSIAVL